MAQDIVARALGAKAKQSADYANQRIDELPKGLNYKGAVDYRADLDNLSTKKIGDLYTVKYKGTSGTTPWGAEFAWGKYDNVNQWIQMGEDFSADIQALQNGKADKATTLAGYGITDAKIESGTITLGDQSITPLTNLTLKTVNGSSLIGSGNVEIKTYQPFPNGELSGTLQQVVSAIMAFPTRAQGMAYLGSIRGSCTPFGYGNVECKVEFMTSNIAVLTCSSSNISPYHWEYNTAQSDYTWRKYSDVIANPEGTSSNTLSKISIDGVSYNIAGGSGAVSSVNGLDGAVVLNAASNLYIDETAETKTTIKAYIDGLVGDVADALDTIMHGGE